MYCDSDSGCRSNRSHWIPIATLLFAISTIFLEPNAGMWDVPKRGVLQHCTLDAGNVWALDVATITQMKRKAIHVQLESTGTF